MSKVEPKIKSLAFDNILITCDKIGSGKIYVAEGKRNEDLLEVQTVVKLGPFSKKDNGLDVEEGDKVLIVPGAKMMRMFFDKETGEYVGYNSSKEPDYDSMDEYLLTSNRAISVVFKK